MVVLGKMLKDSSIKNALLTAAGAGGEGKEGGGEGDVVFALFLEPHHQSAASAERPTLLDRLISFAVDNLQPRPALAHVELVVPCAPKSALPVNFATYIGDVSGWRGDAAQNESYYLSETASKWRAVPVFGRNAARAVRRNADRSVGVEYSLLRYVTAARAVRALAALMPDGPRAPAHCATLTARVLGESIPGCLRLHSAAYGPSSLYAELCERLAEQNIGPESTQAGAVAAEAVDVLLRGRDEDVSASGDEEALSAVRVLTLRAAAAEACGDGVLQVLAQHQLATALLRWSVLRGAGEGRAWREGAAG